MVLPPKRNTQPKNKYSAKTYLVATTVNIQQKQNLQLNKKFS
jgi:hypothetical protein